MELDIEHVAGVLGLPGQQFEILVSIYAVEHSDKRASPGNIMRGYEKSFRRKIASPNFFTQLKRLQEARFVRKTGVACYSVDLDRVREVFADKRELRRKEIEALDKLSDDAVDEYFSSQASKQRMPVVYYTDFESIFSEIVVKLKRADKVYILTYFPIVSYPYPLAKGIGRGDYVKALWDRCFDRERMEIFYLTDLNVDLLFSHAFRVFGNPRQAYEECKIAIDLLHDRIDKYLDRLHVRFMKDYVTVTQDMILVEGRDDLDYYLLTKDEHMDINGGIYINETGTAAYAKKSFLNNFEFSSEVSSKLLNEKKRLLDKKYGFTR